MEWNRRRVRYVTSRCREHFKEGKTLRYFKIMRCLGATALVVYFLFLTACGSDSKSSGNTGDKTVSISISPDSASVELGKSVTLTVRAQNTDIVWPESVEGTFTHSGNQATYFPPSVVKSYTFTVAAAADRTKTVTAKIKVVYADPTITITPATSNTKTGKPVRLSATFSIPEGQPRQEPVWAARNSCGVIDQTGLLSPSKAGDCTVTATLTDINNKKITATAVVKVSNLSLGDIMDDMSQVKGGTFTMGCTSEQGSDCMEDENPSHSVTLNDFYIGKYAVTQAVWKLVMGDENNPSQSQYNSDNLPVENVSWDDIQTFISKLNEKTGKKYRLPTEAEWEYAARGGAQSKKYKYSGSNTLDDVAWYVGNSDGKTHPPGMKQANELGLYDMSGNVYELVGDWYDDYSDTSQTNPTGPATGSSSVVRGGSWSSDAERARTSYRAGNLLGRYRADLGFRLACTSK